MFGGHRAAGAGEGPHAEVAAHVPIQRAPLAEAPVAQRALERGLNGSWLAIWYIRRPAGRRRRVRRTRRRTDPRGTGLVSSVVRIGNHPCKPGFTYDFSSWPALIPCTFQQCKSPPPSPQSLLQFVHLQVASGNEQVVILLLVAAVRQSPRVYEVQKKRQYSVGQTRSLQFHQGTSRGQDRCQHRTGRCQDTPGGGKSCSIRDARSLRGATDVHCVQCKAPAGVACS
ncbi:uncharacterized protein LOC144385349 [Gasterosteus aculeatus]